MLNARSASLPALWPPGRRFWEWGTVVGISVMVQWLANLMQQVTIKQLGAPQARFK